MIRAAANLIALLLTAPLGSETVEVRERGAVDLAPFECRDITRSSLIQRVCYDQAQRYLIVGIRGTHSCMARGSAANWTRDGSGSWYHYHVRVGPTRAFATGGDGLWRREAGSWVEHGPYNDRRHYLRTPIALDLVGDTPFVIAALALESPRLRLATFDGAWRVFAWPSAAHVGGVVACRMPDGSILAGDNLGVLWRLPAT